MINNIKKPEILAPAGGAEQLTAAIRCGADAVYLGTKNFNARNSASNFDAGTLSETVSYCHARDVKVYVAMNTLVTDSETEMLKSEMRMIAESGADAVIVQDLAVAAMWKKYCPSMKLNASTQMTVHNVHGAREAEKLGFGRIVLARELSLSEIRTIANSVDAEIEVFVHGALCMSVSGTCLLSSMIGARSGNRGRCAQPCRLNFKCRDREYALSLKDLSVIDKLSDLSDAGVASFKIEGRMKRPEYVAAAVTAVKNSLDSKAYDMRSLQAIFSRSGFTDGYLTGRRDLSMFGYRRHEDVKAAQPVLKELAGLYKDEIRKIPVRMEFNADENRSELNVSDGENFVSVCGEKPQKAVNKPLDSAYAEKFMTKTGGTIFYPEKVECSICDGITLSASAMNSMRRTALDELYKKRSAVFSAKFTDIKDENFEKSVSARLSETKIRVRFEKFFQSFDDDNIEKIILPLTEVLLYPDCVKKYVNKLVCELPALVFPENENAFDEKLKKLHDIGVKEVTADNLGVLNAAIEAGFIVHVGHGLNVLNSISFGEYVRLGARDITVSPEMNMENIAKLSVGNVKKGILAYGFIPLMRFRACPAKGENGCDGCKGLTLIKDRYNKSFYIICSDKKYSSLLNSVPLYVGDKELGGVDFATMYFTFESPETCKKLFDSFVRKKPLNTQKTGGLYYRELL